MKNDFSVTCPDCEKVNIFMDDNWHDELLDDSDNHSIDCMFCGFPMIIEVTAIYSLKVIENDA